MAAGDSNLHEIISRADRVALPVIVLGEFQFGVVRSRKRAYYEQWLHDFILRCRVLLVDEYTAFQYANIRDELKTKGRSVPSNDAWMAALARQHSLSVLSPGPSFRYRFRIKTP